MSRWRSRKHARPDADTTEPILDTKPSVPFAKPDSSSWRPRLLSFHQLPAWMRDNEFILHHYRPPTFSYPECFRSLAYLHNETGNVYSHLLGAALFVILAISFAIWSVSHEPDYVTWGWIDLGVVFTFCAGAIGCMGCSALFHLVSCHSEPVASLWNKCDYLGIVFLIVGSFYPAVYFAFYCFPMWQISYLASLTILGLLTSWMSVSDHFQSKEYRVHRAIIFSLLGCSGVIPLVHTMVNHGLDHAVEALGLWYFVAMGVLYLTGAFLYGARIPERFYPGKFDLFFHSHQLFHVFVVIAAWLHYVGIMEAFEWVHGRDSRGDPWCKRVTM